jgi:hypothetical protein
MHCLVAGILCELEEAESSCGLLRDQDLSGSKITAADDSGHMACTVFARSNARFVGSNPIEFMGVCIVCLYSVSCVILCVGSDLATG